MRRMTLLLGFVLVCSSPVFAQQLPIQVPIPITLPSLCCQFGTTYGTTGSPPHCSNVPIIGPALTTCKAEGGTLTNGPCNADGACGGSAVCCEGVKIGETCSAGFAGGPGVAQPESCAVNTEAVCDGLSAAGEHATKSVTFATCTETSTVPGGVCEGPPPK